MAKNGKSKRTESEVAVAKKLSVGRIFEYEVIDPLKHGAGTVEGVWVSPNGDEFEFVGVKTGLIGEKMHLVPADGAVIDDANRAIHVRYPRERIEDAPSFGMHDELSPEDHRAIIAHFRDPQSELGMPK